MSRLCLKTFVMKLKSAPTSLARAWSDTETMYHVTHINWATKIKDELLSGSDCRESFINRMAQLYLPAEEPGGGWNRFYKVAHVETGAHAWQAGSSHHWLSGKMEIATISNVYEDECKCNRNVTSIPWETPLFSVKLYLTNVPYMRLVSQGRLSHSVGHSFYQINSKQWSLRTQRT